MSALEVPYVISVGGATGPDPTFEFLGPSGSSGGVSCTPNASANTKATSFTEIGTASIDADGFFLQINAGESGEDYLVDIGTGAAASESVLVSNFLISGGPGGTGFADPTGPYIPLPISAGTRLSARSQCSSASAAAVSINIVLAAGRGYEDRQCSTATTYGANTADSGGTSIDPGGSTNTDGSWVQLSASVSAIEYLVGCIGNQRNVIRATASWRFDLGVGAAAAETVVVPQSQLRSTDNIDMVRPITMERSATWAASSRLSARARCSVSDAADRLFDLVVIGFS